MYHVSVPVTGGLLGSAVEHEGVLLESVPGQAAHVATGAGATRQGR